MYIFPYQVYFFYTPICIFRYIYIYTYTPATMIWLYINHPLSQVPLGHLIHIDHGSCENIRWLETEHAIKIPASDAAPCSWTPLQRYCWTGHPVQETIWQLLNYDDQGKGNVRPPKRPRIVLLTSASLISTNHDHLVFCTHWPQPPALQVRSSLSLKYPHFLGGAAAEFDRMGLETHWIIIVSHSK